MDAVIEAHATQIPEFEPMPLSELYTETEGKVELGKPIGTKLDRVVRRQLGGALSTLFRHGMNEVFVRDTRIFVYVVRFLYLSAN